ncbi:MAG: HAD family hydrolase [Phycisphaeraceae bacterium]|nr:MAG: HAD family hydrolase [Phycisphaeraceae bacterium]
MTLRIAMWSGPRNISTAMMRSWSSRADTRVSDEPFYAHYLSQIAPDKRATHPAADEVMASMPTNWRDVVGEITGPCEKPVWYQKHMAHHLTPAMDPEPSGCRGDGGAFSTSEPSGWAWIAGLANVFLIREPAAMITSFIKVIENPTPVDLGLPQQVRLFDFIERETGSPPPVLDACDVLADPRRALTALCDHLGLPFDAAMLAWSAGPHPADGVWAPHWYSGVYASTGFAPYRPKDEPVPDRLAGVLAECQGLYDRLAAHRMLA